MHVLIIYATVEGQTGKVARFAASECAALGHEVMLVNADERTETSYKGVDAVVLAAPVHERRHPKAFEALIVADKSHLAKRPTLLMSVSLSAAFPEGLDEARDYMTELEMRTGFTPSAELLVAGAVRTSRYDYFASQVVRHVLLRGRAFDRTVREHEFTDWTAVSSELSTFLRQA